MVVSFEQRKGRNERNLKRIQSALKALAAFGTLTAKSREKTRNLKGSEIRGIETS
jgi:hypothetical protein